MYILDQKSNLGSVIIPVGADNIVTVLAEFEVIPPPLTASQFSIRNNGDIAIGDPNSTNNVILNTGLKLNFRQLTGTDSDYLLTSDDYMLEVASDTYNTITLPSALGKGGISYVVSRGSTVNNNLVLRAQINETIDSRTQLSLVAAGDHIRVISNNIDTWYIV